MKDIRALLLQEYKQEDWNTFIETHLSQINLDGSANINMIRTTMSKRVFLQRIVGPSMTARILRGAHEKVEELTKNVIEQKSRFEQLLLRLEMTQSDGWID